MRLLGGLLLLLALTACGSSSAFSVKVVRAEPQNSREMAVWVRVTNNGSAAGTPQVCNVDLYDRTGKGIGSRDGFALVHPIPAGASKTVGILVDVHASAQQYLDVSQSVAVCS